MYIYIVSFLFLDVLLYFVPYCIIKTPVFSCCFLQVYLLLSF